MPYRLECDECGGKIETESIWKATRIIIGHGIVCDGEIDG